MENQCLDPGLNDRIIECLTQRPYKFSFADLKDITGVGAPTWSKIKHHQLNPSLRILLMIKKKFPKIDYEYLIKGTDNQC